AADGQIVLVDLSALSSGASSLKAGSAIAVYGTPGDQKFQAMGLIQPDNQPPAKPVTVPPRRRTHGHEWITPRPPLGNFRQRERPGDRDDPPWIGGERPGPEL